jgi:hypothetical protein
MAKSGSTFDPDPDPDFDFDFDFDPNSDSDSLFKCRGGMAPSCPRGRQATLHSPMFACATKTCAPYGCYGTTIREKY